MSTFITLILVSLAIITAIAINKRKENNNKKVDDDGELHLGEMPSHDFKSKFAKKEKDYAKWYSRQLKQKETIKSPEKEKEETKWIRK